jgi:uncharacterized OB-fold protein
MGDIEYGRCDICKLNNNLTRTYFHFPIACQCCGSTHHEMISHCSKCKPKMPKITKVELSTSKLLDPITNDLFKKVR